MIHQALAQSGYYFITSSSDNPQTPKSAVEQVREALAGGARIIQYREKALPYAQMLPIALQIRFLTRMYNAVFIVNDHVDLAAAVNADGVHLGQSDISYEIARAALPDKIIGVSVSDERQAELAVKSGASYISFSPLMATSTKVDGNRKPCGLETLEKVRRRMDYGDLERIPLVGIGGIGTRNFREVIQVGADLVCSIHPVVSHNNITSRVESFMEGARKAGDKRIIYY